MAIGEAGSITTNSPTENAPITINLTQPLTDPVFALTATNNGGNQFTLRVTDETLDADGNTIAFTFIIEEWEYHDGPHPATETINWIAVEEGIHTLPDGRIIEAGTVSADNTNSPVTLQGDFAAPPVVLTSVMSENDTTTVDSDPLNITADGFVVRLQEEEGQDGVHADETVGWIAIQAGGNAESGTANTFDSVDENTDILGLGATFTDGVVVAETQTINGGDTATVVIDGQTSDTVGVFIEEEQSRDAETNHIDETVGIVAFEDGLIPCLTAGTRIQTPSGPRLIDDLQAGDSITLHGEPGTKDILRIFRRDLDLADLRRHPHFRPVRIKAGALNGTLPQRDLLVSRQHRMLVSSKIAKRMFGRFEVLIPAIKLVGLPGIFVDETVRSVTYYHLLCDAHVVIYAEGAPTESLYTGKQALKALLPEIQTEILSIFPEIADETHLPQPARRCQSAFSKRHWCGGI
ncbi:Hint domain-containing protein [Yoonia sp. SS1-5]|uniref:Hint domain-containing protein n=1 Tax=Yoonia rhodophyticola TaxID=3137370 RepID=A0AAN0MF69_9RHOB